MYTSIRPGKLWKDTEGKPIQAHGFSVFYKDGTYYWLGENKEFTKKGGKIWHWGVRCYTSKDLYNWEDKGLIIPPEPGDLTSPLHPTYCMDRPHILFCPKTKKYVAWLKIMGEGNRQFFSILQADHFFGPYSFVRKIYQPLKMNSGDFCFAESGGKAYVIFERPHFEMVCATLTDDYTAVTEEYSTHYEGRKPPYTREAPTYFERNGKKYLFTSGFNSQITCVLRIPGKDLYVAMADRWVPSKVMLAANPAIQKAFIKIFAGQEADRTPVEETPLPGKEQKHNENTSISRYVFLPIEWEGEKPVLRWKDEWRLEDFQ